ncbi:DNA polymerase epsilon subunit 4 [Taenia crassiceps]|uniref:DNA polymerase epsilon subunit 4 n=1 Tax=Taenia crassiceps TaxID=6207 RepID=A0ABR4QNX7_9CEST
MRLRIFKSNAISRRSFGVAMDDRSGLDSLPSRLISNNSSQDLQTPIPGVEINPHDHMDEKDLNNPIGGGGRGDDGVSGLQVGSNEIAILSDPTEAPSKLLYLPTSRIRSIIKTVPTIQLVNSEAVALIGKSTELFLSELAREAHQIMMESGKKTLSMVHIEGVIQTLPQFEFLDGMLV